MAQKSTGKVRDARKSTEKEGAAPRVSSRQSSIQGLRGALAVESELGNDIGKSGLSSGLTRETLEATPERALQWLRGIGTSPPVMARLQVHGFGKADAEEGWKLLLAASGFAPNSAEPSGAVTEARSAIAELDAADEKLFRVLRATLTRHAPAMAEQVLNGLSASEGVAVVVNVNTLLDRLEALEKATEPVVQRAFALLEQRGYGKSERERLRALVQKAQSVPNVDEAAPRARAEADAVYVARLEALRAWYEEWAAISRAAITRRDQLIRLGLASRRVRSVAAEESESTTLSAS